MKLCFRLFFRFFFLLIIFFLFSITFAKSQNKVSPSEKVTLNGYIKDKTTGEYLIGASIYVKELKNGTVTNAFGFYSITLEKGNYTLVFSYLGYIDKIDTLKLYNDQKLDITLDYKVIIGKEITITGEISDKNIQSTDMGRITMDVEKIKTLPAFMGEVDILKTLQLLPGVKSAGEGNSGFYVRGGGPDQNLVLLDEAVVYNPSHLFGFFSVFNADAVKSIELVKGGMPANYGGKLASVIDISLKEGNMKKIQAEGGIGLISSRLTIQGPIKKDTASFIVSGRRTYIDILADPFIKNTSQFKGSGYYFYDLNTKINYKLSSKDRLFLSGYFGKDIFNYANKKSGFNVQIPWGNSTGSLRWNHLFSNNLFLNLTGVFSDYNFQFGASQNNFEFKLFSGVRDWNVKADFNYYPHIRHNIKFGLNYIFHTFIPNNASARQGEVKFNTGDINKLYAHESACYISDDFDLSDKIKLNLGIRYSIFEQVGPFERYVKDKIGQNTDTIRYSLNEKVAMYGGFEPRTGIRYSLNSKTSVKASFTQNYQYIHMATLSGVSLPTDTWVPSTSMVKPQFGRQYSLGFFRNFLENKYESSIELYYKQMKNQVEYKEGALPENDVKENPDNSLTFGNGKAYGIELFIKKTYGSFNGWIGYTLSKTIRQFPQINQGLEYYARYDRRHDISLVANYNLGERWVFSAVFVYASGNAITLPVARYFIEGNLVEEFGARNSFRMAPYHRADISITRKSKHSKRFESNWNFSIFNIYNRHNPYFIYFDNAEDAAKGELKLVAKQVSLFPILPSISWNFKF